MSQSYNKRLVTNADILLVKYYTANFVFRN